MKAKFRPLEDKNDHLRAEFWDKFADNFVSITGSLSSRSLFKGELRLCSTYLKPRRKSGKFLKLDLWNEVHNTPIMENVYEFYNEVHGVDIAPRLVKRARENMKKKGIPLKAKVGDIRKLPYKNSSFDYIFTMGTIEHIPKPVVAMREIYRVLKPGGRAVIGVPNKYEWFGKSVALNFLADTGLKGDGREKSYGWKQLIAELESCGFGIVEMEGPYFMPWFIRLADWFFYQKSRRLKYLLFVPIWISDWLSSFKFLRTHGGSLLSPVVEKPKK